MLCWIQNINDSATISKKWEKRKEDEVFLKQVIIYRGQKRAERCRKGIFMAPKQNCSVLLLGRVGNRLNRL